MVVMENHYDFVFELVLSFATSTPLMERGCEVNRHELCLFYWAWTDDECGSLDSSEHLPFPTTMFLK